jgi:hypothetical protein
MFMGGDIMRRTLATLAGSAALGFALMDAALAEPVDDTLLVEGPEGEITFGHLDFCLFQGRRSA